MVEVVGPSAERGAALGEQKLLRVLRQLQVAVRRRHRGRRVGVARLHGGGGRQRQGQRGGRVGQLLHLLEGEGGQVGQLLGRRVERKARRGHLRKDRRCLQVAELRVLDFGLPLLHRGRHLVQCRRRFSLDDIL